MDLLWLAASYILGSIPSAYIVAKAWKGIDIRQYGSGNVGGANTWTHVSFWAFVLVGLADASKGALAVAIGQRLGLDPWTVVACGWAAIIGHNWSLFFLLRAGGKGLAPAIGALLVLGPTEALAFLLLLLIGHITRAVALLAFFSLGSLPILAWALGEPVPVIIYTMGAFLLHIVKRVLDIRPPWQIPATERKQVILYRLFLDRDTRRPEDWVYRKPD